MRIAPQRTQKITTYVFGIIISLVAPFVLMLSAQKYLPDCHVISSQYIDRATQRIHIDAVKANPLFTNVERIKAPGQHDQILFSKNNDIIRMVLADTPESAVQFIKKYDDDISMLKTQKGINTSGTTSSGSRENRYRKTRFSDGKVSFIQGFSGVVLQVICDSNAFSEDYFERIGIIHENNDISEWQRWLCRNAFKLFIIFLGIYSVLWMMAILKGGTWIAAIHPAKGVQPVTVDQLKNRLLKINELDVPFKITQKEFDAFTAEWRIDKKWQGLLEKEKIDQLVTLDMKLHSQRQAVAIIEKKLKLFKQKGIFTSKIQFEIFRGITFSSYDAATTYGLSYADGKFNFSGYAYTFNMQEMKNPLVEVVVQSGWKWEPRIFFL